MARHKNADWNLAEDRPGWEGAQLAVLMDIRDELQTLNRLLHCVNFQNIPHKLDRIEIAARQINKRIATKVPLR